MNEREEKRKLLASLLDVAVNIVIIVILVYTVRTYLIAPFQVFGPSMCNTLNFIGEECRRGYGEYLIVNKAMYQNFFGWQVSLPERGDIVVFKPNGEHAKEREFYIKRIIGIPGDEIKIENGYLYLKKNNGAIFEKLEEPYLNGANAGNTNPTPPLRKRYFKVPDGNYFMLGDNRNESTDSRSCFSAFAQGCKNEQDYYLELQKIEGKAWVVLWPFSKIRLLDSTPIL